jgi:hypothetical protein
MLASFAWSRRSRRGRQGNLRADSPIQPTSDCLARKAGFSRPLHECLRFAIKSYVSVRVVSSGGNGLGWCHSGSDSTVINSDRRTEDAAPFDESLCILTDGDKNIASRVSCLLNVGSPTHVASLVIAVLIGEAVQTICAGRPHANVSCKYLEGSAPFGAHGYPSSSVILVDRRVWVITSVNDSCPNHIKGSSGSPVRSVDIADCLSMEAAA